ncbi:MAG TPA: hypothetical protein ENJ85_05130 [Oceanithermus profundus]|uniref:Uncharacterized protein n=1 Tax=Oceanithermus profundus TaxID=187137 RepID=A0A7C5WWS8_9DEIN|nr:hypothetical protein [Oceanithermus profundus]
MRVYIKLKKGAPGCVDCRHMVQFGPFGANATTRTVQDAVQNSLAWRCPTHRFKIVGGTGQKRDPILVEVVEGGAP